MFKIAQNKRVNVSGDIELKDRLVGVQRVVKVTKGGRAFRFSAIVVVGDEKSIVGIGLGKSNLFLSPCSAYFSILGPPGNSIPIIFAVLASDA